MPISPATRHYPILREYVRKVAEDLVARGRIRRGRGQTIDVVIQHEMEIVIAEVAGDVRALAVELGVGAARGGASLIQTLVQQLTNEALAVGVNALFEVLAGKPR